MGTGLGTLLGRYVGRQFLFWFFTVFVVLGGVIYLFELVEVVRQTSRKPEVGAALGLKIAALKLPQTVSTLFHFTVLFSAMLTFWRLTRSQELVVARAAGVSAWQFLKPVLVLAAAIGLGKILIFNPVASALFQHYERLIDIYVHEQSQLAEVSRGGLWLRQLDENGIAVIHAEGTDPNEVRLKQVIFFLYAPDHSYKGRLDAETASLRPGYWHLRSVKLSIGEKPSEHRAEHRLPTPLTPDSILDSFAAPETLSFWTLPEFIRTLEATGFSALQHRLHYQSLLAQPILLPAMVMFAAAFSLRFTRRGGGVPLVIAGILTGFMLFVLTDIVLALGLAESIPPLLAAWAPAGIGLLLGTALLLHLEDG